MLAVAIIVFREAEALEPALIVSIVMAASIGSEHRKRSPGNRPGCIERGDSAARRGHAGLARRVDGAARREMAHLIARLVASRPVSAEIRVPNVLVWAVMAGLGGALLPGAARAEIHVRSPLVTYREFEFEMNGFVATKSKAGQFNNGQSYTYALGYGVLPWWMIELEGETGAEVAESGSGASSRLKFQAATIENTFQLTPDGKYFVNAGIFFEYSQGLPKGSPNSFAVGPILQKELNNTLGVDSLHTLNVFIGRSVGANASNDTSLFYAWQSKALLYPLFNPGIELYGEIANLAKAGQYKDQGHSIGPVITGVYIFAPYGKIRYEVGYQWGLSNATARGGVRWRFEYEIAF